MNKQLRITDTDSRGFAAVTLAHVRRAVLIMALSPACGAAAQSTLSLAKDVEKPEEIVITGQHYQLQKVMLEAEKHAYEIFDKFNDDKRFNISCSVQKPTGSLLQKQSCAPEFEIQATQAHAQDYLQSLGNFINPVGPETDGSASQSNVPMEVMISKDLAAYRKKLKQVAEQHPEFLEAIIKYSKAKENYEKPARMATDRD